MNVCVILLAVMVTVVWSRQIVKREDDGDQGLLGRKKRAIGFSQRFSNNYYWPSAVINYDLDSSQYSEESKAMIRAAMKQWTDYTCVTFKQDTSGSYVKFIRGSRYQCTSSASVGKQRKVATLMFGEGCMNTKLVSHELAHVIGLFHEQMRWDRDSYVTVDQSNIQSWATNYYGKIPQMYTNELELGIGYDYLSITHYGPTSFAKDASKPVMTSLQPMYEPLFGRATMPSFGDVKTVNAMYQCAADCTETSPCPNDGFRDKDCKCRCSGETPDAPALTTESSVPCETV